MKFLHSAAKLLLVCFGVVALAGGICYFAYSPTKNPVWGVNFSPNQARYLGLDARETFAAILTELKPKKIRLTAYWELLEPDRGKFNFEETDDLLEMADRAGAKVTLVVGRKQPRWPECHEPSWYKGLGEEEKKQAVQEYITAAVSHFKSSSAVERWQVENEPFFNYGADCPVSSAKDIEAEIASVKSLDSRPVVLTDSGEKGGWLAAARRADIFGTTMYRTVHNPRWGGYVTYPLPPAWYRMRGGLVRLLAGQKNVIGVELQAEPWFDRNVHDMPPERQMELVSMPVLNGYIAYARRTGLPEHYLWGAEWWYYMKSLGHAEYWERVRTLMN